MGLEVVTKGPFQMPYGLKLPDMLGRRSLERKFRRIPHKIAQFVSVGTPIHVDTMQYVAIDRRSVKVCHYSFAVANGRWISDEPFRDASRRKCAVMQLLQSVRRQFQFPTFRSRSGHL